jgi:hypothetical protein
LLKSIIPAPFTSSVQTKNLKTAEQFFKKFEIGEIYEKQSNIVFVKIGKI